MVLRVLASAQFASRRETRNAAGGSVWLARVHLARGGLVARRSDPLIGGVTKQYSASLKSNRPIARSVPSETEHQKMGAPVWDTS